MVRIRIPRRHDEQAAKELHEDLESLSAALGNVITLELEEMWTETLHAPPMEVSADGVLVTCVLFWNADSLGRAARSYVFRADGAAEWHSGSNPSQGATFTSWEGATMDLLRYAHEFLTDYARLLQDQVDVLSHVVKAFDAKNY
ncbi:hypothetical protein A3E39_03140 [Candidatus Uhrbacteria bacterium RIFCSPHIGHO2_12_FULL_60_25]|uniref:Uncharacterized protein n=1 Tax=Candidatus Uhrbacteria bacterium RIFCSPHIGHO2_12_FULL_60_25 TaxID=1802399 RepID=A0A1F7UJL7_9BACT|nr:MAG: hypothetical protein A3D73_01270 [Candidatus Uhrbacteria bacterium RIFCSPHIGHO2_02_FULL_60_44]OGL78445.1 MAG: hypothetical protein A3E39_03140 [Candidatus Uhrbacteria bacterium RIFCSPHIGHO2_12_FULL_60_25]